VGKRTPDPTEAAGRACGRQRLRGTEKVRAVFGLIVIVYNLIRLGNLLNQAMAAARP